MPGESFMITAWIDSPLRQQIAYELRRGAVVIAKGAQAVASGSSRLLFRDTAGEGGAADYTLRRPGRGTRSPCPATIPRGCWWACAGPGRCCA